VQRVNIILPPSLAVKPEGENPGRVEEGVLRDGGREPPVGTVPAREQFDRPRAGRKVHFSIRSKPCLRRSFSLSPFLIINIMGYKN
jgi:hypothetical protein